jgi:hypothetical protein
MNKRKEINHLFGKDFRKKMSIIFSHNQTSQDNCPKFYIKFYILPVKMVLGNALNEAVVIMIHYSMQYIQASFKLHNYERSRK